ncbi:ATP-binding protein [Streptomyces sp. MNU76]|uniref:ATP-binding protein n=1 Tax=Streptomyces sp. MNU76 TaxID=2560026 RepID=UPI001E420BF8|nr:ATP-binding protein [Streptomyces sp. MNU76]MCC9707160.1 ATP-binding protein [Streptomyces sp. MNU76]
MARRNPERPTHGFTVAAAVDAVPAARRQVVSLAQDLGLRLSDQTLETVELLAGEVIANAVLYTDAPCDVSVTRAAERLRIEVTDMDASLPTVVEAGPNDESGRGLLLVNALADAWGTQPELLGKTTWFEITPGPSTDGLGNDSVEGPPSPHAGGEPAVQRTECQARMASPANARWSFLPVTAGKEHQAA